MFSDFCVENEYSFLSELWVADAININSYESERMTNIYNDVLPKANLVHGTIFHQNGCIRLYNLNSKLYSRRMISE